MSANPNSQQTKPTTLRAEAMNPLFDSSRPRSHDESNDFRAYPAKSAKTFDEALNRTSTAAAAAIAARPKKKKSVRFVRESAVRLIPTHDELSDDEYVATYYTEEEKQEIMMENVDVIRALRKGGGARRDDDDDTGDDTGDDGDEDETDRLCSRGLEAMIDKAELEFRTAAKKACADAVLDLQYRQYEEDYADDEEISLASQRISAAVVRRAIDRAQ
eukprot:CAMPEP_0197436038 /NCGR_PEP_ID=MMETSP1175-20131217/3512_1 /TAXON_ID=1003142 /ORGANISM="Triceratium dubium, Strain CCMP147" /LENGTH=216 /DNA_ID=CAMNT_0042965215 /DNA_START=82 /DNA_END=729 /DNA_ORIENTATION=-